VILLCTPHRGSTRWCTVLFGPSLPFRTSLFVQ
jgi:hypothetical protein